jgi:DNA polymerase-3 subunit alpha
LEGLIKVGALDCFAPRHQLLAIIDRMINLSGSTHKAAAVGQMSMFDLGGFDAPQTGSVLYPLPDVEAVGKREMLGWEKELVGTYLSDHPIQRYMAEIKAAKTTMLGELDETMHNQQVFVAGMINSVRHHQTKKGAPMAFVEIEDIQTTCEIVVFPRAYETHKELLVEGKLVLVKGKVDAKDGRTPKILADTITNEIKTYGAVGEEVTPGPPSKQTQNGANTHRQEANGSPGPVKIAEPSMPHMPAPPQAPPVEDTPETEPTTSSHWLHITLRRTDSLAQDKYLLKTVFDLLTQNVGNDRFSFYIPGDHKKIRIDFPNQTTRDTAHLRQQLTQLLGATSVRVD